MESKLDQIINILNQFDKRLINIENKLYINNNNNIANIIPEMYNLDGTFIRCCLEINTVQSDMKIIKKYYLDDKEKNIYPFKFGKVIEYWHNNTWKNDQKYLVDTLINNIKNCYVSINKHDKYIEDVDQFLKNQNYIVSEMNTEKYRTTFLKELKNLLN